jgi:D-tyrosyl-tRNA(Tyr) deacylase
MRAVVQRVSRAEVRVGDEVTGRIGTGLLVLLGVGEEDTEDDAAYLAEKIAGLRTFEDTEGKMNRSVVDVQGSVLAVSQFTLLGDCRKGRRPSFSHAAEPETAERLYQHFVDAVRRSGIKVATGRFRAHMDVELVNDGPVTLLVDSRRRF